MSRAWEIKNIPLALSTLTENTLWMEQRTVRESLSPYSAASLETFLPNILTIGQPHRKKKRYQANDTQNLSHNLLLLSLSTIILSSLTLVVELDGIKANDTKEGQILIGEEGTKIAKDIRSRMTAAAGNGNLSLTINGTKFVADGNSFNISEPKQFCTKGQTFKDGYCR